MRFFILFVAGSFPPSTSVPAAVSVPLGATVAMGGKKRVKFTRPTSRNEDSGAVCAAWVPRSGSVTDAPSGLVLLGRDDDGASEKGVAVRDYNFDTDTLSDTVRIFIL